MALHYTLLRFLRDTARDMIQREGCSPQYRAALTTFADACDELSRFH